MPKEDLLECCVQGQGHIVVFKVKVIVKVQNFNSEGSKFQLTIL